MESELVHQHPGLILRDLIAASGLTQGYWAARMGITQKHMSQLCTGQVRLSADTAVLIEDAADQIFGQMEHGATARKFARMQADCDIDEAWRRHGS